MITSIHDYDQLGLSPEAIICSSCEEHPLEMAQSDAITRVLRTVAQEMNYEFEMDPAEDVFIDILSLQEILPDTSTTSRITFLFCLRSFHTCTMLI